MSVKEEFCTNGWADLSRAELSMGRVVYSTYYFTEFGAVYQTRYFLGYRAVVGVQLVYK